MYREYLGKLAPPWLQGARGRAWLEAHGEMLDVLVVLAKDAVKAHLVSVAPEDALPLLGAERGLERLPGEYPEAYRARLLAAWEYWRRGGTVRGVKAALEAAGYDARVIEHFRHDRSIWAEFSIVLYPLNPSYTAWAWDSGVVWNGGQVWDYDLASTETNRVREIIEAVKAAHAKLRKLVYARPPGFAWDDETVWDGGRMYDYSFQI